RAAMSEDAESGVSFREASRPWWRLRDAARQPAATRKKYLLKHNESNDLPSSGQTETAGLASCHFSRGYSALAHVERYGNVMAISFFQRSVHRA
ncbi:MAG TPA: hypothetical protein VEM14_09125, partial [Gemmatimonadaceae bacterium]|nr:hypothetical protein [Gemmatimonadaceae bacterium]